MFEQLYEYLVDFVLHVVATPISPGERFYVLYVITFILLAYVSYRKYYARKNPSFFKFLFPRKIYRHKSAVVDYYIYFINALISPLTALVGVGLQTSLSIYVASSLVALNSGSPIFAGDWSASTYLLFILGFTLIADFSVYLIHRMHHELDVLWPIHALHHSAEVLTPFTLFRKHPVWNVASNLLTLTLTGLFQGLFVFVFYGNPQFEMLFGINSIYMIYNFFGSNLRHSHVWLSWGGPLSHLFISPAMHQVHHDPTRMRKNYGEIFAIWDWMFGSLYIPEHREEFRIGLGENQRNPHDTVWKAYYVPVVDLFREIRKKASL